MRPGVGCASYLVRSHQNCLNPGCPPPLPSLPPSLPLYRPPALLRMLVLDVSHWEPRALRGFASFLPLLTLNLTIELCCVGSINILLFVWEICLLCERESDKKFVYYWYNTLSLFTLFSLIHVGPSIKLYLPRETPCPDLTRSSLPDISYLSSQTWQIQCSLSYHQHALT